MNSSFFKDLSGDVVTIANLPPKNTRRWVLNRKYIVVMAVKVGMISLEECLARYEMTEGELQDWEDGLKKYGVKGLMATKAGERVSSISS